VVVQIFTNFARVLLSGRLRTQDTLLRLSKVFATTGEESPIECVALARRRRILLCVVDRTHCRRFFDVCNVDAIFGPMHVTHGVSDLETNRSLTIESLAMGLNHTNALLRLKNGWIIAIHHTKHHLLNLKREALLSPR